MITNRTTFLFGILIIIVPFLGFPSSWKTILIIASGASVISASIKMSLPTKKTSKIGRRREKITPVFVESMPTHGEYEDKKEFIEPRTHNDVVVLTKSPSSGRSRKTKEENNS